MACVRSRRWRALGQCGTVLTWIQTSTASARMHPWAASGSATAANSRHRRPKWSYTAACGVSDQSCTKSSWPRSTGATKGSWSPTMRSASDNCHSTFSGSLFVFLEITDTRAIAAAAMSNSSQVAAPTQRSKQEQQPADTTAHSQPCSYAPSQLDCSNLTLGIRIELNIVARRAESEGLIECIDCPRAVGWYKDSARHQPATTVNRHVHARSQKCNDPK